MMLLWDMVWKVFGCYSPYYNTQFFHHAYKDIHITDWYTDFHIIFNSTMITIWISLQSHKSCHKLSNFHVIQYWIVDSYPFSDLYESKILIVQNSVICQHWTSCLLFMREATCPIECPLHNFPSNLDHISLIVATMFFKVVDYKMR